MGENKTSKDDLMISMRFTEKSGATSDVIKWVTDLRNDPNRACTSEIIKAIKYYIRSDKVNDSLFLEIEKESLIMESSTRYGQNRGPYKKKPLVSEEVGSNKENRSKKEKNKKDKDKKGKGKKKKRTFKIDVEEM